jgi:hypothetical protein
MNIRNHLVYLLIWLLIFGCSNSKPSVAGEWTLYQGKAVDILTLQEKDGVLTGHIKLDPAFVGGTSEVHGILSGTNIEFSFDAHFDSSTPGDTGNVNYSMKGSVNGNAMGGSFSVLGSFSSLVSKPAETALWVAKKNN